jgi:hypothetical protein
MGTRVSLIRERPPPLYLRNMAPNVIHSLRERRLSPDSLDSTVKTFVLLPTPFVDFLLYPAGSRLPVSTSGTAPRSSTTTA